MVRELTSLNVDVWWDQKLLPGSSWDAAIREALLSASAVLAFVSESLLESEYATKEIELALANSVLVLPVVLPGGRLPASLGHIQAIFMDRFPPRQRTTSTAREIARAIARGGIGGPPGHADPASVEQIARLVVRQATEGSAPGPSPFAESKSVFVVHGHDNDMLEQVKRFLHSLGVQSIIIRDEVSDAESLLAKFFELGGQAGYAIVLPSGDDYGASRRQYDEPGVGERALQFRARQNVILELGFFYGRLGWENVLVFEREPPKIFPNFERPSDLNAPVFNRFDQSGTWQIILQDRLRARGLGLP